MKFPMYAIKSPLGRIKKTSMEIKTKFTKKVKNILNIQKETNILNISHMIN